MQLNLNTKTLQFPPPPNNRTQVLHTQLNNRMFNSEDGPEGVVLIVGTGKQLEREIRSSGLDGCSPNRYASSDEVCGCVAASADVARSDLVHMLLPKQVRLSADEKGVRSPVFYNHTLDPLLRHEVLCP